MAKHRTQVFITLWAIMALLGIVIFNFSTRNQAHEQTFPATIHRDCAPWDGSAFTASIPIQNGATIEISIWRAPDIQAPVTFSFPDNTGQVGNASYHFGSDQYKQLHGSVFFWRVEAESQVTGRFDLVTEAGQRFAGQFKAEWRDLVMLCG